MGVKEKLAQFNNPDTLNPPPQALGKELNPLKSWLFDHNVSEQNVKDVTWLVRAFHLDFMKLYNREYARLPQIGVSCMKGKPMFPELILHVRYPDEALTDPMERLHVGAQIQSWYPGYVQSLSSIGLLINVEFIEEIPVDNPDFIGILDDTPEEKAQREHAFNLMRKIHDKYVPIFHASEGLKEAYNQQIHDLVNKPIYEQEAMEAQLEQRAANIKRLLEFVGDIETGNKPKS